MIVIESTQYVINTDEVQRGTLMWARHKTWDEGETGIVSDVSEDKIVVRYLPSIQNVQNHFIIPASELEEGSWQVRYSSDGLETVQTYGPEEEGGGEESGS